MIPKLLLESPPSSSVCGATQIFIFKQTVERNLHAYLDGMERDTTTSKTLTLSICVSRGDMGGAEPPVLTREEEAGVPYPQN